MSSEFIEPTQPNKGSNKSDSNCLEEEESEIDIESELNYSWSKDICLKEESETKYEGVKLLELPEEIIYLIFSFLSIKDLVLGLKITCKIFNQMLNDCYFKRRMRKFIGAKDNEVPRVIKALIGDASTKVSWKYACFKYEFEYNKWCDSNFSKIQRKDFSNNTSSVDVAKILGDGKLVMTGGRDRILSLWNIENNPKLLSFNERVHSGWIWDVVPNGDTAYSCDWDGKIFEWSIKEDLRQPVNSYQIGRPILCLAIDEENNRLIAGLQTGELCFIDPRIKDGENHQSYRVHKSAIMGIQIIGQYVVSISEDKTLSVYDLINDKQFKKSRISGSSIPVSMSRINSALYIAQTNGCITLINASTFKIWEMYSTINCRLTSIHASHLGSLITASRDGHVSVYSPGKKLKNLKHIYVGAEVARIDYNHGILAVARSDNKTTIYDTSLVDQSSD